MTTQRKAVALISGGLDSMLAAKTILEQGIHVEGINFYTGFCVEGHTHAIRNKAKAKQKRNNALWVAEQLGIKLHIIDVVEEYKDVVLNPQYGYGANLNPCLDCKVFMIKHAHQWLEEYGFDFIITGEVVGQRPKSQLKHTMGVVAKQSGAKERLLRPLSAKNLPPTLPEQEGWVDRNKLFGFSGRGRKPQMHLATHYGFKDYAQPAGGCCFLTDKYYSEKLKDLWSHRGEKKYELDDIMLLKVGRHIRPSPHFKLIIARDEGECNFLEGYRKQFISIRTLSHTGPLALIDTQSKLDKNAMQLAASIVARFSSGREQSKVTLEISLLDNSLQVINVTPISCEELPQEWYV